MLSEEKIKEYRLKKVVNQSYFEGTGTVMEITRGRGTGSKQVTIDSVGTNLLITFPDLPWAPSSLILPGSKLRGLFLVSENPKEFTPWSYEAHLNRSGISYVGRSIEYEVLRSSSTRDRVGEFISEVTDRLGPSNGLDLIHASILGRGEVLSKDQDELFKQTSTTHLIVVSGFHVGVLSRISGSLLVRLIRFYPKVFLFIPAGLLGPLFGLLVAIFYGYIIGFSLTVVRALIALFIVTIGQTLFKRANSLSLLLCALVIIQTLWPGSIFEPGCQLTFAALLGLVLSEGFISACKSRMLPDSTLEAQLRGEDFRMKRFLFDKLFTPAVTCFVVGLVVAPVTLLWFQVFVPLSSMINIILIPIFTVFVLVGGGGALFAYQISGCSLPLNLAVYFSQKVGELTAWLNRACISIYLGPVQVSPLGSVALALLHVVALIILFNIFKYSSKAVLRSRVSSDTYADDL